MTPENSFAPVAAIEALEAIHASGQRLLDDVDPEVVNAYLMRGEEVRLVKGECALSRAQANNNLYLVLEGVLSVHLDDPGKPPLATLGKGECFGEMSVFDGALPSAYVVAMESSRLWLLDRETLWALIRASHAVSTNLLITLTQRLRFGNASLVVSEQHANADPLTGVYNRRWLRHVYERDQKRCVHDGKPMALLMVDIDRFKDFNDQYGHLAGDVALKAVARALQDQVRPNDLVARFGGEEFIILLPGSDAKEARDAAERIRVQVSRSAFEYNGESLPALTVSVGIAIMIGNEKLEELAELADAALYKAKHQGRNRVCG